MYFNFYCEVTLWLSSNNFPSGDVEIREFRWFSQRWCSLLCWGPAWGTPPMAKVMRKEAWHRQRRDRASGNPLFPSIYPQIQGLPTLCSHLHLWLYGGLFPTGSLREGVNSQLQSIKIPGRDKGVSGQTSLLVDELVWQDYPHSCHYAHDCLQPLNHKQHRELGVFWKS